MKGIVASTTLDEFVSEIVLRYKHVTPGKNYHNSLGFNSDELRLDADVCYYGCSFTHGVGVESYQRWTDIVDYKQGYLANNFGIPGACIDDILSVFVTTTKFVKMKRALFLLPDYARQTLPYDYDQFGNPKFANLYPELDNTAPADIIKIWFSLPDLYYADRAQSAINLITYIADINNIELYFSSWSLEVFDLLPHDKRTKNWHKNDKLGTDNSHPGPDYHDRLAQEFIKLL